MRILLLTLFLLITSVAVSAQDTVKVVVALANSEITVEDIQGIQAELDAKIYKGVKFRIGGVFHYVRPQFDAKCEVDTYSFGPSVSYSVFSGKVEFFGRGLFGVTTNYEGLNRFTRAYGVGVDVNLGHIVLRPFVIDRVRIEGAPVNFERYGAGVGVRF